MVLAPTKRQRDRSSFKLSLIFFMLQLFLPSVGAEQFGVSAAVQKSPPQIALSWDAAPYGAANYTVYRSTAIGGYAGGGGSWTALVSVQTATSWVDNTVLAGTDYEYRIERTGSQFDGNAYLNTGIEVPFEIGRAHV